MPLPLRGVRVARDTRAVRAPAAAAEELHGSLPCPLRSAAPSTTHRACGTDRCAAPGHPRATLRQQGKRARLGSARRTVGARSVVAGAWQAQLRQRPDPMPRLPACAGELVRVDLPPSQLAPGALAPPVAGKPRDRANHSTGSSDGSAGRRRGGARVAYTGGATVRHATTRAIGAMYKATTARTRASHAAADDELPTCTPALTARLRRRGWSGRAARSATGICCSRSREYAGLRQGPRRPPGSPSIFRSLTS